MIKATKKFFLFAMREIGKYTKTSWFQSMLYELVKIFVGQNF